MGKIKAEMMRSLVEDSGELLNPKNGKESPDSTPLVGYMRERLSATDGHGLAKFYGKNTRSVVDRLIQVARGDLLEKLLSMDTDKIEAKDLHIAFGHATRMWLEATKLLLAYTAGRPREHREVESDVELPEIIVIGPDTPDVVMPLPENEKAIAENLPPT